MCNIKLKWNQFLSSREMNCLTLIRHKINIALQRIDFCKWPWTRNPSRRNKSYYRQLHQNSRVWYRLDFSKSKFSPNFSIANQNFPRLRFISTFPLQQAITCWASFKKFQVNISELDSARYSNVWTYGEQNKEYKKAQRTVISYF